MEIFRHEYRSLIFRFSENTRSKLIYPSFVLLPNVQNNAPAIVLQERLNFSTASLIFLPGNGTKRQEFLCAQWLEKFHAKLDIFR